MKLIALYGDNLDQDTSSHPKVTGSFSRPADNVAYTAGDHIANSTTGSAVVPITFTLSRSSGRITGCRCVVTPASGNLIHASLDFDLLLFRPETSIPYAAAGYPADNVAFVPTPAAFRQLVAVFSFTTAQWRIPAGTVNTTGTTGHQTATLKTPRASAVFNTLGLSQTLIGVVQAQAAWTPLGVVNQFDFDLDVDMD